MGFEDKLKHIITESVQEALNENFRCSINVIRNMYLTMCSWEKVDYPGEGYEEFKVALKEAIDKLGNVLWIQKTGKPSPTYGLRKF